MNLMTEIIAESNLDAAPLGCRHISRNTIEGSQHCSLLNYTPIHKYTIASSVAVCNTHKGVLE